MLHRLLFEKKMTTQLFNFVGYQMKMDNELFYFLGHAPTPGEGKEFDNLSTENKLLIKAYVEEGHDGYTLSVTAGNYFKVYSSEGDDFYNVFMNLVNGTDLLFGNV